MVRLQCCEPVHDGAVDGLAARRCRWWRNYQGTVDKVGVVLWDTIVLVVPPLDIGLEGMVVSESACSEEGCDGSEGEGEEGSVI
jgi:hypothetical protein